MKHSLIGIGLSLILWSFLIAWLPNYFNVGGIIGIGLVIMAIGILDKPSYKTENPSRGKHGN